MKKLMEIYGTDNGLIIKKFSKVYHLFVGIENEEDIHDVKIADEVDAMNFMLDFFHKKLKLKEESFTKNENTSIYTKKFVKYSLMIREQKSLLKELFDYGEEPWIKTVPKST
jgi:hypothetical protein